MNKFIQHVPTFVASLHAKHFEFETQLDLICRLKELNYGTKDGSWFELSDNRIMEVSDEGYYWWVCGYVRSTAGLDLPKWEAKERPKKTEEQKQQYLDECKSKGIPVYDPRQVTLSIGGHELTGFAEDTN